MSRLRLSAYYDLKRPVLRDQTAKFRFLTVGNNKQTTYAAKGSLHE